MELLWCGLVKHGLEDDVKKVIIDMMEKVDVCEVPPAESLSAKRHRTGLFGFLNKAENCASPRINQPVTSKAMQSQAQNLRTILTVRFPQATRCNFEEKISQDFPAFIKSQGKHFAHPEAGRC